MDIHRTMQAGIAQAGIAQAGAEQARAARSDARALQTPDADDFLASPSTNESLPEFAEDSARSRTPAKMHLGNAASDREILLSGRRAFECGDDDAAIEHLTRLVKHGIRYADVYYMIGIVEERRGHPERAVEQLREAIRINPSYVEALLALASLHESSGDFDQSQGYAQRAAQLSRPSERGLDATTRGKLANQQAELGDALAYAGERRDAIEQYRSALDRCPTFHDIRHRLAMTLRDAGLPFQAAQEFARILRLHPRMLESQVQLGLTYYVMGRTPDAIGEWDAVLEKDPSRDEARMYLRLVRGAERAGIRPALEVATAVPSDDLSREDELDVSGWSTAPLSSSLRATRDASKDASMPFPSDESNQAQDRSEIETAPARGIVAQTSTGGNAAG